MELLYTSKYTVDLTVAIHTLKPNTPEEKEQFIAVTMNMKDKALSGEYDVIGLGGTKLFSIPVLAGIRPIIGRIRDPSSTQLAYRFSSDLIYLPLQMVTPASSIQDLHLQGLGDNSLPARLHPHDVVVCQCRKKVNNLSIFGSVGTVESIREDGQVIIHLHTIPVHSNAGTLAIQEGKKERWYTAEQLRSYLKLSARAILGIAGYYPIFDNATGKKKNIGLGLYDRNRMIPGK